MLCQKLATVGKKRANSKPLPSGIAPYTSSDHFKIGIPTSKPKARSWEHRFSLDTQNRNPAVLKAAAQVEDPISTIPLGTGRPAPEFYPWTSMVMSGTTYNESRSEGGNSVDPMSHMSCIAGESAYDLSVALNYGYAAGSPQLLRFITEHVELIHDPPYDDWETCLTCGTTSALNIALQMFCNRGDWILAEGHTFSGAIDAATAQGLNILGVKMDELGLFPDDLDLKLDTWDTVKGKKPLVLYVIPSGHNPTGITQSRERRKAIYQVAEKHDLYIIEDDPYYFLQLGQDVSTEKLAPTPVDEYLQRLPISYLSLDISGRVMRLDATSKILAPGLRCGWLTASSEVVRKFLVHTDNSTISPSGPSQVMLYKLLDETWGHEGFINWLSRLSAQYRHRRNILTQACERQLPSTICNWIVPAEGMFLWIQINLLECSPPKPGYSAEANKHFSPYIEDRIYTSAKRKGVLISKGSWFAADRKNPQGTCFRITFAAAPCSDLDEAVRRFGEAIRETLGTN